MLSFALGTGTQNTQGDWLEVYYPAPLHQPAEAVVSAARQALKGGEDEVVSFLPEHCAELAQALRDAGAPEQAEVAEAFATAQRPLVAVFLAEDHAPESVPEVYLKLHLLSHRLVKPHGIQLDGMFSQHAFQNESRSFACFAA